MLKLEKNGQNNELVILRKDQIYKNSVVKKFKTENEEFI